MTPTPDHIDVPEAAEVLYKELEGRLRPQVLRALGGRGVVGTLTREVLQAAAPAIAAKAVEEARQQWESEFKDGLEERMPDWLLADIRAGAVEEKDREIERLKALLLRRCRDAEEHSERLIEERGDAREALSDAIARAEKAERERDKARSDVTTIRHTTVARLCEERDQAREQERKLAQKILLDEGYEGAADALADSIAALDQEDPDA